MGRGRKRVNNAENLQIIRKDPAKLKQYNTYIKTLAAYFQRIDDANAGIKDTLKNATGDLGVSGGFLRTVTRQKMAGGKDFLVADTEALVEGIELAEGQTGVEEDGYEVDTAAPAEAAAAPVEAEPEIAVESEAPVEVVDNEVDDYIPLPEEPAEVIDAPADGFDPEIPF